MNAEVLRMLATILFWTGVAVMPVYFWLFSRLIGSLAEEERHRFTAESRLPTWRRVVALLPVPVVLLVSEPIVQFAATLWFCIQLALDSRTQHRLLAKAGFDATFLRRLTKISVLAGVSLTAWLLSMPISEIAG
jgi:hypothetical protein